MCIHAAFPVLLIFVQGDAGTALVFAVMVLCMMWAAGVSWKYFLLAFSTALAASPFIYFFVMNEDHRKRIKLIFDINADIKDIGYQQWRGRMALANGGLTGQGFLKGDLTQAGVIPESHNDFIFTSIGEEFGFLGTCGVIILILLIVLECISIARKAKDLAGTLIAMGIAALIGFQSFLNISVATGVIPNTGLPLPFVSYGLTSLLSLYIGIGLLLNVRLQGNSRKQATNQRGLEL